MNLNSAPLRRHGTHAFAIACLAVAAAACGNGPQADETGSENDTRADRSGEAATILVDGSSTVYPITEAMAEEFGKAPEGHNTRVTVGISGSGGGFKKFCTGETDLSDASRPIKPSEVELCAQNGIEYIELPVAFDGLAVMVNPENDWVGYMTVAELKRIWAPDAQGIVTKWSQVREGWPDEEMHLFGPGTDSGTYDYFTEAVVGAEGASRGDFQASEDDNILVQGIASDPLAIGFFGLAYYRENQDRLKLVPIEDGVASNGDGPIAPSIETVSNGTYQPLSRPLFLYVKTTVAERPEVEAFVRFYLNPSNAQPLVEEVGYVPLPKKILALARSRFDSRVVGSIFEGKGSQVGVTLEELLSQES